MREGSVDGAEVVGDFGSRPGDGPVHVGDGDELSRCADRLDPAGRHAFGAQQQPGGDFETGFVLRFLAVEAD